MASHSYFQSQQRKFYERENLSSEKSEDPLIDLIRGSSEDGEDEYLEENVEMDILHNNQVADMNILDNNQVVDMDILDDNQVADMDILDNTQVVDMNILDNNPVVDVQKTIAPSTSSTPQPPQHMEVLDQQTQQVSTSIVSPSRNDQMNNNQGQESNDLQMILKPETTLSLPDDRTSSQQSISEIEQSSQQLINAVKVVPVSPFTSPSPLTSPSSLTSPLTLHRNDGINEYDRPEDRANSTQLKCVLELEPPPPMISRKDKKNGHQERIEQSEKASTSKLHQPINIDHNDINIRLETQPLTLAKTVLKTGQVLISKNLIQEDTVGEVERSAERPQQQYLNNNDDNFGKLRYFAQVLEANPKASSKSSPTRIQQSLDSALWDKVETNCLRCGRQLSRTGRAELFQHIITHATTRRFQCSRCDTTTHTLCVLERHSTRCRGTPIDTIDSKMIEEWTQLIEECYPQHSTKIYNYIKEKILNGVEGSLMEKLQTLSPKTPNENAKPRMKRKRKIKKFLEKYLEQVVSRDESFRMSEVNTSESTSIPVEAVQISMPLPLNQDVITDEASNQRTVPLSNASSTSRLEEQNSPLVSNNRIQMDYSEGQKRKCDAKENDNIPSKKSKVWLENETFELKDSPTNLIGGLTGNEERSPNPASRQDRSRVDSDLQQGSRPVQPPIIPEGRRDWKSEVRFHHKPVYSAKEVPSDIQNKKNNLSIDCSKEHLDTEPERSDFASDAIDSLPNDQSLPIQAPAQIQEIKKKRKPGRPPKCHRASKAWKARCQFCQKTFRTDLPQDLFQHSINHSRGQYYCSKCHREAQYRSQIERTKCCHIISSSHHIINRMNKSMLEAWLEKANFCFPNMPEKFQDLVEKKYGKYLQKDQPGCSRDIERPDNVNDEEPAPDDLFNRVVKDETMNQPEGAMNGQQMRKEMVKDSLSDESCSSISERRNVNETALLGPSRFVASEQSQDQPQAAETESQIVELQKLRSEFEAKEREIAEKEKEKAEKQLEWEQEREKMQEELLRLKTENQKTSQEQRALQEEKEAIKAAHLALQKGKEAVEAENLALHSTLQSEIIAKETQEKLKQKSVNETINLRKQIQALETKLEQNEKQLNKKTLLLGNMALASSEYKEKNAELEEENARLKEQCKAVPQMKE